MFPPNRVTYARLTVLVLSVWLGLEPFVIGMTPSWGAVVPHTHILRGPVSDTQWQEHLEQHRHSLPIPFTASSGATRSVSNEVIAASIPDSGGILPLLGLALNCDAVCVRVPAPPEGNATMLPATFYAREMFFAPLDPPPNL